MFDWCVSNNFMNSGSGRLCSSQRMLGVSNHLRAVIFPGRVRQKTRFLECLLALECSSCPSLVPWNLTGDCNAAVLCCIVDSLGFCCLFWISLGTCQSFLSSCCFSPGTILFFFFFIVLNVFLFCIFLLFTPHCEKLLPEKGWTMCKPCPSLFCTSNYLM